MKKIFLILLVNLLLVNLILSQNNNVPDSTWKTLKPVKYDVKLNLNEQFEESITNNNSGNIEIIADDKINKLVVRHIAINDSLATISGFRIQIFSISGVNSIAKAEEVKANFIRLYPDYGIKLDFVSPNYKVRIGAFRTKLEALKFLNLISLDFPGGYLVADDIEIKELQLK